MKRKVTAILLTAFLIGSFYNTIYSQDFYEFAENRNIVIAANGLNMRSKPNTASKKLVNIPYGEKVQILHKDHYGLDTVYTIQTELGDHPVFGHWQKVKYNEYTGFVHNAFLTYDYQHIKKPVPGINSDFILLLPGYNCAYEFYNTNEYFWYGYYQKEIVIDDELEKPYRKLVDLEFINIASDMSTCGTIVKENRDLKFIIGSKHKFPEGNLISISEKSIYHRIGGDSIAMYSTILDEGKITMVLNDEPSSYFDKRFFYLQQDGITQLLNTVTKTYRIKLASIYREGDFDGDGKTDYIFYHGEDDLRLALYLSSQRDEEQAVKLVSLLRNGPCC